MDGLWDELVDAIIASRSKKEANKILESLISDYEKKIILKRLGVIALARTGKSYREISEALWLSPNTISTIKKNILDNRDNYKSYRKFYGGPRKYSGEIRIPKSFWKELLGDADIWSILTNPPRPRGIGILSSAGVPSRPRNYCIKRKK